MQKPIAPACSRNKDPILDIISVLFAEKKDILEIGSGSGEHAVYFSAQMPWLRWQTSDLKENLMGIQSWTDDAQLPNLPRPIELDINTPPILQHYDAIFTANTLHIFSEVEVKKFFQFIPHCTAHSADLVIYGPFNYHGIFTADSNAQFDQWLKSRDPLSGIRDFERIDQLASSNGFSLVHDFEMPANNHCLHFSR